MTTTQVLNFAALATAITIILYGLVSALLAPSTLDLIKCLIATPVLVIVILAFRLAIYHYTSK